jgi:hypothetical protein
VLQTFGRDSTYKYMPDIEREDAYSNMKDETNADDYKLTGRYMTSDTCARTKTISLTSMRQRGNGGWRNWLWLHSKYLCEMVVVSGLRGDTCTHQDCWMYDMCGRERNRQKHSELSTCTYHGRKSHLNKSGHRSDSKSRNSSSQRHVHHLRHVWSARRLGVSHTGSTVCG